jgi:low temperature requirement protein LtrA
MSRTESIAHAGAPSAHEAVPVSTLELFFDLVFVFTLTQLTALLEHDVTLLGAARVVLIFVIMYWMYAGYAWLTNQLPPTTRSCRLLLIASMGAFLVAALAIPHAFDGTALPFAVGYLLVVLVHGALYAVGHGRSVWRFAPLNVAGALCLVVAAWLDGWPRVALWLAPLALQYAASRLSARVDESSGSGFDLKAPHLVERHGLLLIVAFGESVVAIGIGLADEELGPAVYVAAVLGLALAAALWWTYFDRDAERAEGALLEAPIGRRVRMALAGYFYAYAVMLLGVVVLAAGLHLSVGDVGAALLAPHAALLAGGTALFLAGSAAFRLALGIGPARYRVVAAAVAAATTLAGVGVSALAQISLLIATVVVLLVAEGHGAATSRR